MSKFLLTFLAFITIASLSIYIVSCDEEKKELPVACTGTGAGFTAFESNAKAYYDEGEYEKALDEFEKILRSTTDGDVSSWALLYSGKCLYMLGNYSDARDVFCELLGTYPDCQYVDEAIYWTGRAYYEEQQYDLALAEFQGIISEHPEAFHIAAAHYFAGRCLHIVCVTRTLHRVDLLKSNVMPKFRRRSSVQSLQLLFP